jgi:hypothetical protein
VQLDRYRWVVGEVLAPGQAEDWHRRRAVHRRIAELSRALRKSRARVVGRPYLDDDLTLTAYLAYFVPWNLLALREVLGMHGHRPPTSLRQPESTILDLGAGPLVLCHFLALRYPELGTRHLRFRVLDHAPRALEVGREILDRLLPGHQWEIRTVSASLDEALDAPPRRLDLAHTNLVVDLFSLNEWARSRYRRKKLLRLAEALTALPPRAEVLCVEPGNREAGRLVPAIRQELLAGGTLAIQGPCTHHQTCPLVRTRDRSWCHFRRESRHAPDWLQEVSDAAGLGRQRLCFSYLWGERTGAGGRRARDSRDSARVIGEPMPLGPEEVGVYACSAEGRIILCWTREERPPRRSVRNGRLVRKLPRSPKRVDRRSGAPVFHPHWP